jgi:hypothetical protein
LRTRNFLTTLVAATTLAACSSSSGSGHGSAGSSSTRAAVVTPSSTSSAPAVTPPAPASEPSSEPGFSGSAIPSGPGAAPAPTDRELHLNDFFNPGSGWSDKLVNVADQRNVSTIQSQLNDCGSNVNELELRLLDAAHTLSFDVGQDDASTAADQSMTVTLIVDGNQRDAKAVKFNKIVQFANENMVGANDVKIDFTINNGNCDNKEVFPVIFHVKVT